MWAYGIDVSNWQGVVNWDKLNASTEVGFVYLLVSDGIYRGQPSGSVLSIASAFERNKKLCTKPTGGYHFFRVESDPFKTADATVRQCGDGCQLPICLDVEGGQGNPGVERMETNQLVDMMDVWLTTVERLDGRRPVIYAGYFLHTNIMQHFPEYYWWMPWYESNSAVNPDPLASIDHVYSKLYGRKPDMWQYTSRGRLDGIDGYVDRSLVSIESFNLILDVKQDPTHEDEDMSFVCHVDCSASQRMKDLFQDPTLNHPNLAFQIFSDGTMRQVTGEEIDRLKFLGVQDLGFRDDSLWSLLTLKSRDRIGDFPALLSKAS